MKSIDFQYLSTLSKQEQEEYLLEFKTQEAMKDKRQRVTYNDNGDIGYWTGQRIGMDWVRTFIKVPRPLNDRYYKLVNP